MEKTIKRYSDSTPANTKAALSEEATGYVGDEYDEGLGYDVKFKPFKLRRK